jgi:hypothetical protein
MDEIVTFKVVKEPHGWAVRLPQGAMMPFRWRRLALDQAKALAKSCNRAGGAADVELDAARPTDSRGWRRARQRPLLSWIQLRPLA